MDNNLSCFPEYYFFSPETFPGYKCSPINKFPGPFSGEEKNMFGRKQKFRLKNLIGTIYFDFIFVIKPDLAKKCSLTQHSVYSVYIYTLFTLPISRVPLTWELEDDDNIFERRKGPRQLNQIRENSVLVLFEFYWTL